MNRLYVLLVVFLQNIVLSFCGCALVYAQQPDSAQVYAKRLRTVAIGSAGLYTGTMLGLGAIWYADKPSTSFHFLNDAGAWLSMDKFGHAYATYQGARTLHAGLRWAGASSQKATLWAVGSSLLAVTSIEIFDGFSEGWGASPSDVVANMSGGLLFGAQQFLWQREKIRFRWSYSNTGYAQYRPNALGSNVLERWLKDYNGQIYWLSASPADFGWQGFPKWLGLAIGYGAEGILGGYENPTQIDGQPVPYFERRRQFYLSLDLFSDQLRTRSKLLNTVFFLASALKVPLPALSFVPQRGLRAHVIP